MIHLRIVQIIVAVQALCVIVILFGAEISRVLFGCRPIPYAYIPDTCLLLANNVLVICLPVISLVAGIHFIINRKKLRALKIMDRSWYYLSISPLIVLSLYVIVAIALSAWSGLT